MTRNDVLDRLRSESQHLRERYGVDRLALFGSVARDEALPGSDVDVLVDFNRPVTLFDIVAVQQYLEQCLDGRKVDVVQRDSIYPEFREAILGGAVNVS